MNDGDEDSNLDVQTLLDRILRLKTLLRDANQRSESPIENLEDILYEGSNASKWKKTAHLYKEELEKIKKESKDRHSNDVHGYPTLATSDHEGTAQGKIYLFEIRSLQLINMILSRKITNFEVHLLKKIQVTLSCHYKKTLPLELDCNLWIAKPRLSN